MRSTEESTKSVDTTETKCVGCDICGSAADVQVTNDKSYDRMNSCYEHAGQIMKTIGMLGMFKDIKVTEVKN